MAKRIYEQQYTECTVALSTGRFCELSANPDLPFPICTRHALMLFRHLQEMLTTAQATTDPLDRATLLTTLLAHGLDDDERRWQRHDRDQVVYYVRVGDHIKIGYTSRLEQRIRAYGPTAQLLATEPGTRELERQRLREFADCLVGGKEWFAPSRPLLEHIATLS